MDLDLELKKFALQISTDLFKNSTCPFPGVEMEWRQRTSKELIVLSKELFLFLKDCKGNEFASKET
jgi:hypothetical protein